VLVLVYGVFNFLLFHLLVLNLYILFEEFWYYILGSFILVKVFMDFRLLLWNFIVVGG